MTGKHEIIELKATLSTFAPIEGQAAREIERLTRNLARERAIRAAAEEIAEKGLRELYERQRTIEFIAEVTIIANQDGSALEVISAALNAICKFTGWATAHAYIVAGHDAGRRMWPTNIWADESKLNIARLQSITAESVFQIGEGLPGRVWKTGAPVWIDDIYSCENFPRRAEAIASGIRAAVSIPLLIETEVVAALEFFVPNTMAVDTKLLDVVAQAGTQLGRVIERDRAKDRLHDALHDSLTGLPNRAHFMSRVETAFRRFQHDLTSVYCIFYIDLDGFKTINDTIGHAAGDALLTQVGARISASIRAGDYAARLSPKDERYVLARMGGDEFTVLINGIRRQQEAEAIAKRIVLALANPFKVEGHEIVTGASVGIGFCAADHISADEAIRHADIAMYSVKTRGKGRYLAYDTSMGDIARRRAALQEDLAKAIQNQEFELHYQPIISLVNGETSGFEALVRWRMKGGTLVFPDEFISVAEESGLIVPIGSWVLREACLNAKRWNEARPGRKPLNVSINLSPRQFLEAGLCSVVRATLDETGFAADLLRLEITEAVTMADAPAATRILHALRDLGVRVSIDDFGTGFSCLSYLHRFPLHVLKIDRSFISRMETNMESLNIVKTIVVLARSLGMEVIAEGAETEDEILRLRSLGCHYCQGNYFSPPLPADEVQLFMETSRFPILLRAAP